MPIKKYARLFLAVSTTMAASGAAVANQSVQAPGKTLTTGPVTNQRSILSSGNNPASAAVLVSEDEKVRFGYLPNVGAYFEVGKSKNIDVKIDDLADRIDAADQLSGAARAEELHKIATYANDELLPELGNAATVKAGASANIPVTPFLVQSDTANGVFSMNAAVHGQVAGQLLTSDFAVGTRFRHRADSNNIISTVNLSPRDVEAKDIKDIEDAISDYQNDDDLGGLLDAIKAINGLDEEAIEKVRDLHDSGELQDGDVEVDSTITTDSSVLVQAAQVVQLSFG